MFGIKREYKHKNASGGGSIHESLEEAQIEEMAYRYSRANRGPLEPTPPESLGIFVRWTTPWRKVKK